MTTHIDSVFDCIIVGGGPAGLYSSIMLARFCRRVLIIDNEKSRVRLIPSSHNYPGSIEGIKGTEILKLLTKQANHYQVKIDRDEVISIEYNSDSSLFIVYTPDKTLMAKSILLATGIKDKCPNLFNSEEPIISGALRHCLICDGYEVRNKKIIVFGNNFHAYEIAQSLLTYSNDICVVSCETDLQFSKSEVKTLNRDNITVYNKQIKSITFTNENKTCVTWEDNEKLLADASYLGMGIYSQIPETKKFKIRLDKNKRININEEQMTSMHGIFAAGDNCNSLAQISTAFGSAAIAARSIHQYLKEF